MYRTLKFEVPGYGIIFKNNSFLRDGNGTYVKVPFKVQAGYMTGIGWAGSAIKYFNRKSYDDYFNILENGWQPDGTGLWDKFLRGNSVYSLKGGMKKTTMSGPGGMDMEVYNYSPEFQEKINQAQSINNGMIDRDGNVNINADGKGGYYREDGKFVLNNGQVVSFGSMTAGLNYLANLEGSGLKLSDALRKRLGKALESQNIDWNTLNKSGKSIDYLRNLVKTYKQEKVKAVDEEFVKPEVKDDGSSISTEGDTVSDDGGLDFSENINVTDTTKPWESNIGLNTGQTGGAAGSGGAGTSGSSSSNQQDTNAPNYPGNQSYTEPKKPKTCFHPEQLIGNKFIKDLEPGDLINGTKILGMVKLKLDEDMYSLNDVRVTGTHKVKYNNNWMYVSEHPDSFVINDKPEFVYIPIVEGGIFIINNYEFADYDDEHIETLNNKLKVA